MSKEKSKGIAKIREKMTLTRYNVILCILIVILIVAVVITSLFVTRSTEESANRFLESSSTAQLQKIEEFVDTQKERLISYSMSSDAVDVLKAYNKMNETSVTSPDYATVKEAYNEQQKRSQKFFESVSDTRYSGGSDEGIYVALMDTTVLAHTNSSAVGKPFRSEDSLALLQDKLKTEGNYGVYCAGILISPSGDHEQVLAIYKTVTDPESGNILGFVGMGVYVDKLEQTLGLSIEDVPSAKFSMINVSDNKYIFQQGEDIKVSKIDEDGNQTFEYKVVTDPELLSISNNYAAGYGSKTGISKSNGVSSFYTHNNDYNWLFVITANDDEVYSSSKYLSHFMLTFIWMTIVVGVIIFFINRRMIALASAFNKSIKKNASIGDALQESIAQDMLTGTYSRGAFYSEFAKKGTAENPIYFVQYCLTNMRVMNETITASKTDEYLITVAQRLQDLYGEKNVYRISEKEFVCVATGSSVNTENVFNTINNVLSFMRTPFMANDVNFLPEVDAAVIRQQKNINVSVLTALKTIEVMNKPTQLNNVPMVDRDM